MNSGDIGVINLRLNYFQPGGHDTTQLDKQMTNDTKDTLHLGQTSQNKRQGPTSSQRSLNRRRPKHGPEYQLFFLLVFLRQV